MKRPKAPKMIEYYAAKTIKDRQILNMYLCYCGNKFLAKSYSVNKGDVVSCGCWVKKAIGLRRKTHGMFGTPIYGVWASMKTRCYNSKCESYSYYGGRGIVVCKRWHKFENFYKDMGDVPIGMQLDRKNNNKNYTPSNCKWSTPKENSTNRRSTLFVTYKNQTNSILEWSRLLGINYMTLLCRIKRYGWSVEKAFETPISKSNRYKKARRLNEKYIC
jgi:hypothetical protein